MIAALNRQRLRALCGDDRAQALELIALLIDDAEAALAGLEEQFARRDPERVTELAHGLKGVAANVGADELRAVAEQLQAAAGRGELRRPEQYAAHVNAVRAALDRVREAGAA